MSFESTLFPPKHEEPANALQSDTAGPVVRRVIFFKEPGHEVAFSILVQWELL